MELNLEGKVAIVTGGASGIGRVVCHNLAMEKAKIAIINLNRDKGLKVVRECRDIGTDAINLVADISCMQQCYEIVQEVVNKYGRVDILIHGAAPYTKGEAIMPFLDQNKEMWASFINVIIKGTVYITRAVLPLMLEKRSGRIIYISSDAGRAGDPFQAVYSTCKATYSGLMKSLSWCGSDGNITTNIVSPALTLTEENKRMLKEAYGFASMGGRQRLLKAYPTGKLATAQDLAHMIVFLASEKAERVTGQVVGVNGGFFMPSP